MQNSNTETANDDQIVNPSTLTYGVTNEQQSQIQSAANDLRYANLTTVDSADSYHVAAENLVIIKTKRKELFAARKRMTEPLDAAKKEIMGFFHNPITALDEAEAIIKACLLNYSRKLENKLKEEQAAREEIARKEQERLRKRAELAENKGKVEKADTLHQQADSVPIPIYAPVKTPHKALSTRKTWYAEIIDEQLLIEAVAAKQVPKMAVTFNLKFLNQQASALKKEMNYPGVKAKTKDSLAVRT